MTARELIAYAAQHDIHLSFTEGRLCVDGPPSTLSDDVLTMLREQKPDIIAALNALAVLAPFAGLLRAAEAGEEIWGYREVGDEFYLLREYVLSIANGVYWCMTGDPRGKDYELRLPLWLKNLRRISEWRDRLLGSAGRGCGDG